MADKPLDSAILGMTAEELRAHSEEAYQKKEYQRVAEAFDQQVEKEKEKTQKRKMAVDDLASSMCDIGIKDQKEDENTKK